MAHFEGCNRYGNKYIHIKNKNKFLRLHFAFLNVKNLEYLLLLLTVEVVLCRNGSLFVLICFCARWTRWSTSNEFSLRSHTPDLYNAASMGQVCFQKCTCLVTMIVVEGVCVCICGGGVGVGGSFEVVHCFCASYICLLNLCLWDVNKPCFNQNGTVQSKVHVFLLLYRLRSGSPIMYF